MKSVGERKKMGGKIGSRGEREHGVEAKRASGGTRREVDGRLEED